MHIIFYTINEIFVVKLTFNCLNCILTVSISINIENKYKSLISLIIKL